MEKMKGNQSLIHQSERFLILEECLQKAHKFIKVSEVSPNNNNNELRYCH
jgi:hypothetical protein